MRCKTEALCEEIGAVTANYAGCSFRYRDDLSFGESVS